MKPETEKKLYNEITQLIYDNSTSLEVDVKKKHLLILKMLSDINQKMDRLEKEHFCLKN